MSALVGLAVSIAGAFGSLSVIVGQFVGHESGVLTISTKLVLSALLPLAVFGGACVWRRRRVGRARLLAGWRACPAWFWVAAGVLLSLAAVGELSIWLVADAQGEPLPQGQYLAVVALGAYTLLTSLFQALLSAPPAMAVAADAGS